MSTMLLAIHSKQSFLSETTSAFPSPCHLVNSQPLNQILRYPNGNILRSPIPMISDHLKWWIEIRLALSSFPSDWPELEWLPTMHQRHAWWDARMTRWLWLATMPMCIVCEGWKLSMPAVSHSAAGPPPIDCVYIRWEDCGGYIGLCWMKINVDAMMTSSSTGKSLYLFNDTLHHDNKQVFWKNSIL